MELNIKVLEDDKNDLNALLSLLNYIINYFIKKIEKGVMNLVVILITFQYLEKLFA